MAALKDASNRAVDHEKAEPSPPSSEDQKVAAFDGSGADRTQSVADIYGLDGLTLYEKKCVLVNREVDGMGMGKYQWCLWGLCGRLSCGHAPESSPHTLPSFDIMSRSYDRGMCEGR